MRQYISGGTISSKFLEYEIIVLYGYCVAYFTIYLWREGPA